MFSENDGVPPLQQRPLPQTPPQQKTQRIRRVLLAYVALASLTAVGLSLVVLLDLHSTESDLDGQRVPDPRENNFAELAASVNTVFNNTALLINETLSAVFPTL